MAGGAGLGDLVAAQGLAGGPGGIQRIGLRRRFAPLGEA
jgi:hypothetical protein